MTHLCLSISANDLEVPGGHEEAFLLFLSCLVKQGGQEHAHVQIQRPRMSSLHKASKKYQGRAFERGVIRCERNSNVNKQSEGRREVTPPASMNQSGGLSSRTGALPLSVLLHDSWQFPGFLHC